VTDCYQPVERNLEITRKSLREFLKHQISISILTKNKLAERDFDLLSQFDECEFGVSLSILDSETQKILEPGASTPDERIVLLKKAKKMGIQTYAFIGPIHPFLSDVEDVLNKVLPYVDFIMAEVPNLHCGNWESLKETFGKLEKNIDYAEYKQIAGSKEFYQKNKKLITKMCQKNNVKFRGIFKH